MSGDHETIVAVAFTIELPPLPIRNNDPMIFSKPAPARHDDCIHHISELIGRPVAPDEQGFLTSAGRYVSRPHAHTIAKAAGQPFLRPFARGPDLFSEDLW